MYLSSPAELQSTINTYSSYLKKYLVLSVDPPIEVVSAHLI